MALRDVVRKVYNKLLVNNEGYLKYLRSRGVTIGDCMLKVISGYPCERLGITQRAFVELLRRRTVSVLYLAASYGVF